MALLSTPERLRTLRGLRALAYEQAEELLYEASDAFCKLAGREFHWVEEHTEMVAGYGTPHLILTRAPVLAVISLSYEGTLIDPETYQLIDGDIGVVERTSGVWPSTAPLTTWVSSNRRGGQERRTITAVYESGFTTPAQETVESPRTLPRDIERAVLDYATTLALGGGRDRSVVTRSVPRGSVSYSDDGYPAGFAEVAKSYRLPGVL